jgi:excisionase family DNA binding protein
VPCTTVAVFSDASGASRSSIVEQNSTRIPDTSSRFCVYSIETSPDSAAAAKWNSLWVSNSTRHARQFTCKTEAHSSSALPYPDSNAGTRHFSTAGVRHRGHDMSSRMSIPEIASRLGIGRLAVYSMLERGLLPGIRLGRRWIVTRPAFEAWEKTCGTRTAEPVATGFLPDFEVNGVN